VELEGYEVEGVEWTFHKHSSLVCSFPHHSRCSSCWLTGVQLLKVYPQGNSPQLHLAGVLDVHANAAIQMIQIPRG